MTGSKIELRLRKGVSGQRWEQLEDIASEPIIQHNRTKNWDQIGKEADEEAKKDIEEGGGEAALQQMFKVLFDSEILLVEENLFYYVLANCAFENSQPE